jgi:SagB-type dehydrogenase family enzyme
MRSLLTVRSTPPQRLADRLAIEGAIAPDVLREVEKFHRRSSLLRRSRFGLDMTVFHDRGLLKELQRRQLRVSEHSAGFISDSGDLGVRCLLREGSQRNFAPADALPYATLNKLLFHSFANRSAAKGGTFYPCASAGAVYAVNVFAAPLMPVRDASFTADSVVHLDHRACELFRMPGCSARRAVYVCLDGEQGGAPDSFANAALMLAYVIDLELSTLRYAERGYRYSLIESGSMAQQATLVGQSLGLRSCLFGGFPDAELASALGVNARKMLPCLVQFFGLPMDQVRYD